MKSGGSAPPDFTPQATVGICWYCAEISPYPAALLPSKTIDFMLMNPYTRSKVSSENAADLFAGPENTVGSGAFMFKGWELSKSVEVNKNPNCFK